MSVIGVGRLCERAVLAALPPETNWTYLLLANNMADATRLYFAANGLSRFELLHKSTEAVLRLMETSLRAMAIASWVDHRLSTDERAAAIAALVRRTILELDGEVNDDRIAELQTQLGDIVQLPVLYPAVLGELGETMLTVVQVVALNCLHATQTAVPTREALDGLAATCHSAALQFERAISHDGFRLALDIMKRKLREWLVVNGFPESETGWVGAELENCSQWFFDPLP